MQQFASEERQIREENLRLQRRLQLEMERREALCRHLSESESSLEMEDERHFHESFAHVSSHSNSASMGSINMSALVQQQSSGEGRIVGAVGDNRSGGNVNSSGPSSSSGINLARPRPGSSPGPFVPSPGCMSSRPMSPGASNRYRLVCFFAF